ncbi:hypothetical protein [Polynucleobacter sp. CS-Odin-A6]|uniref:hypothetical protein n=1 Tax=Polynucleobacter sp. CS-Odin-A6 TaxID=2689106 RepID=UPI001C0D04F9|nr:hypothetical protein [Polynucleobacter sp. CS-Odin-A6]MBU3621357.1 hypothetical protein [Polynucleobacter sp. CS-Odin-A6]
MPPRHISPQSFDDILSELGDDPAIPDPHGIRKSSASPRPSPESQVKSKSPSFSIPNIGFSELKAAPILMMGAVIFMLTITMVFFLLESNKASSEEELNVLKSQISTLKNELVMAQDDWHSEQENLYIAIDEIEVNVHSIQVKPPILAPQNKPITIPHEAELRRWRYLGLTRMGATEQAFFHNGKTTVMVGKEGLALGEWRLTQAEKALAKLTHPKGKSITLKSTKSE